MTREFRRKKRENNGKYDGKFLNDVRAKISEYTFFQKISKQK